MLVADAGALTSAAGQVEATAGALADIDVAGPFGEVSDALVGSQTSQACLWVSTRMGAAVQVYADRLRDLAGSSRHTAADLTRTDRNVADSFGTP
jgi:hypothetical protein